MPCMHWLHKKIISLQQMSYPQFIRWNIKKIQRQEIARLHSEKLIKLIKKKKKKQTGFNARTKSFR